MHQVRTSVGLQRTMLVGGFVLTGIFIVTAVFAPWLAPYGFAQIRVGDTLFGSQQPPSSEHWFGTTVAGYDVLSRVHLGCPHRRSCVILTAVLLSVFIGVAAGLLSGYFGGWVDRVLVVIADAVYAFPSLLLAIVAAIVISGGQSSMWAGIMAAAHLHHRRLHPAVLPRDPG